MELDLNQQNYDNINNIRFDIINIIELFKKSKINLEPDLNDFKDDYISELKTENSNLLSKIKPVLTDTTQKCLDSEECLQNKKKYYQICEELKRYGQKYEKLPRDEYINQGYEVLYDKTIQKVSASTPPQDRIQEVSALTPPQDRKVEKCNETIVPANKKEIEEGKASTWGKNVGAYCDPKFPDGYGVTKNFKSLISGDNLETLQTELLNYYTDKARSPHEKHIPGNNLSEIWKHIKKNCQNECEDGEGQILENKFNVIREKVKSKARPILEKEKKKGENSNCNYQKCINDYNRIRSLLRELDDEDGKGAGGKKSIKKKRKIINNKLNKKSKKTNKLNKKNKKTVSKKNNKKNLKR